MLVVVVVVGVVVGGSSDAGEVIRGSDDEDEGVEEREGVTVDVTLSEFDRRVEVMRVVAVVLVVSKVDDDLVETGVDDVSVELGAVVDSVLEGVVVEIRDGELEELEVITNVPVSVTTDVRVFVDVGDDKLDELDVTTTELVFVTVGVMVTVATSELVEVGAVVAEVDEAGGLPSLSKHPTCTPATVVIGTARHDKPVLQVSISKVPVLEHVPMLPLIQATWPATQPDSSVRLSKRRL